MVNVNGLQTAELKLLASAAVSGEVFVSGLQETRAAFNLHKYGLLARNESVIGFQRWQITDNGRAVAGKAR